MKKSLIFAISILLPVFYIYSSIKNPSLIATYSSSASGEEVFIKGNYAYCANISAGLRIIDISNPATPLLRSTYNCTAVGVKVVGNYAYVTTDSGGLIILDISDPYVMPTLVGSCNTPGNALMSHIEGNYAYVADRQGGMQIINISNPASPFIEGNFPTTYYARGVYVVGNLAYVAEGWGLRVVDISNPSAPVYRGGYETARSAYDVKVVGNYAYVAAKESGMLIFDITNPAAPGLVGSYITTAATAVSISGNYAYISDSSGMIIVNIETPSSLYLIGSYSTSYAGKHVFVNNNNAYLSGTPAFSILDVTATVPVLTLNPISGVSYTTATFSGNVTNDGNGNSTERGFCWHTSPSPTTSNSKIANGSGEGSYINNITSLLPGTKYYVRSYAVNAVGTGYSNTETFTTPAYLPPTATTGNASGIHLTGGTLNGTVNANNQNTTITFEYGTTVAYGSERVASPPSLSGNSAVAVTSSLTGLLPNTTYHFRVKAVNIVGTTYGADMTFTTVSGPPVVTTSSSTGITNTGATLNGTVNANNQSTTATFEYGTTAAYGSTITIDQGTLSGVTNYAVTSTISGLTPNTTYHYRLVAVNGSGTSYGADATFSTGVGAPPSVTTSVVSIINPETVQCGGTVTSEGNGPVTSRGVCWSLTPTPSINGFHTNDGTGTGTFNSIINNLLSGQKYYVRAYASNLYGTAYGEEKTFTTEAGKLPVVNTRPVYSIGITTAGSGGSVTSGGDAAVTARGVCWSLASNPAINGFHTTDGTGTGDFASSLSNLIPGQSYYVRAYATNSYGTTYGQNIKFTTKRENPVIQIITPSEGDAIKDTVKIVTISSDTVNQINCYIDERLLCTRTPDIYTGRKPLINAEFEPEEAEYLFIDNRNILKKINHKRDIKNVFSRNLQIRDFILNQSGVLWLSLLNPVKLKDNSVCSYLRMDMITGSVTGSEEIPVSYHYEETTIDFNYNPMSKNYKVKVKTGFNKDDHETIAFLRYIPRRIISTSQNLPGILKQISFEYSEYSSEQVTLNRYSIDWNTLNYNDGVCKIRVVAEDSENRTVSDSIDVVIRNINLTLNATRKEVKAYLIRTHIADLKFIVQNKKNSKISHYQILRSTNSGSFEVITTIQATSVTDNTGGYYDKNIDKNSSYKYKIVAYDEAGNILSESNTETI